MQIELYPGIVWTRDDYAQLAVARWYRCLDDKAREFVQVAKTWEDIRDILRGYVRKDFATRLAEIGVQPSVAGVVVNIVVVASGMGPEAYRNADEDAARLGTLEHEVNGFKRHLVLLAQHEGLRNDDRKVVAPTAFAVPWLVSSKVSDGRTGDDDDISDRLGHVLDVLMLTSPSVVGGDPAALHDFRAPEHARSHLRMAGRSRVDFAEVMRTIAGGCGAFVLAQCRSTTNVAPNQAREFLRAADEHVGALIRGTIGVEQLLSCAIGAEGMGSWSAQSILIEGPGVLSALTGADGQLARAARGEIRAFDPMLADPPWPWWKRLLAAFGFIRRPEKVAATPQFGRAAECAAALVSMEEARAYLAKAARLSVPGTGSGYEPPQKFVEKWVGTLSRALHEDLLIIADPADKRVPDAERVFRDLASRVELDVSENLSAAISEWSRMEPSLDQTRGALCSERLVIFDGHVAGGVSIQPAAAIGTFQFGKQVSIHGRDVPYSCVRAWRGVRPLFVVSSESVVERDLRW